jgi:DNA polymerase elongation subunit (family B)
VNVVKLMECCKTDAEARVLPEVMEEINKELETPRPWGTYWICKKRHGKLSDIMEDLLQRKEQYKASGLTLKEKALKLFMNSGYGTFGQVYFKYYDPRVAELITGFARHTLDSLVKFVNNNGGKILFGDTDSIFVAGGNSNNTNSIDIVLEAKDKFNVKLVQDRTWNVLFLTSNKKQYVGLTEQGKVVDKGLVGKKNNQPAYFNAVISYLISKEYLEQFVNEGSEVTLGRIKEYVHFVYQALDQKIRDHDLGFVVDKLAYSNKSSKALYEIKHQGWQKDIYAEILGDNNGNIDLAKSKSQANTVYRYWKVNDQKGKNGFKVTMHPETHVLNIRKYKEELWTCIKPLLEAYGLGEKELDRFENEIVRSSKTN